jgi:hypothetical protein
VVNLHISASFDHIQRCIQQRKMHYWLIITKTYNNTVAIKNIKMVSSNTAHILCNYLLMYFYLLNTFLKMAEKGRNIQEAYYTLYIIVINYSCNCWYMCVCVCVYIYIYINTYMVTSGHIRVCVSLQQTVITLNIHHSSIRILQYSSFIHINFTVQCTYKGHLAYYDPRL